LPKHASPIARARIRSGRVAPGVRLHLFPTDRFTTTVCRVALHRDLGPEAAATALLAQTLEAATERHPTREALAHRLADLYGAGLSVGVEKLGDRQLLAASLDWPTKGLPGRGATLSEGLSFLREVLTRPVRAKDGVALDEGIVATEAKNLVRSLRAIRDDKARYAVRRCLEAACAGEPYALDAEGREEDVAQATPAALGALHARLVATAPVEVFLAGDLTWTEAVDGVRRRLLWPGRKAPAAVPPVASARAPRRSPRRLVEEDSVVQGKLAMAFRADLPADSPLVPAAMTIAGILGGTASSRFFKVVRETHGLCYYASAGWARAKGLLLVQSGIEPKNEPRVRRLVLSLLKETASGRLDPLAHEAYLAQAQTRVESMRDDRGAALGFAQEMTALGLDPRPEAHLARLLAVKKADVRRAGTRLGLEASFFLTAKGSAA
jgi:predicted Zn-dependent peptidase